MTFSFHPPTAAAIEPRDVPHPGTRRHARDADGPVLRGTLVPRVELTSCRRDAMFALLCGHFDGVARDTFDADLAAKDHVILLEDTRGVLQGFSTLHVYDSAACGTPVTVIYSGDTIVRREAWGSPALPRTWVHAVRQLTTGRAHTDVYWLLLTSGYRTYRFLPVFYRRFYPRCGEPPPPSVQALLDGLARERFGAAYDQAAGVVRFPRPQVLKPDLLDVPDGRRGDPDVAFFLSANPGFIRGDELVCLTRMHEDNLTPAARRMMRTR